MTLKTGIPVEGALELDERVALALDTEVTGQRILHGGDLSGVAALDLADGRRVVAKTGPLVEVEARMLRALSLAEVPVPDVLHTEAGLLVMAHLPVAATGEVSWSVLGKVLAHLHGHTAPEPGWPEPYAFGEVTIQNDPAPSWPDFWAERRLLPDPDDLPADIAHRIEALCQSLPERLPEAPTYSLLHGDLWTGNVMFGPGGTVHLIDPACYHGDAEVDLAMLHLFGQPGPGFDESYGPLAEGWEERRRIYTLWPALVHLRLFGDSYRGMVEGLLDQLRA